MERTEAGGQAGGLVADRASKGRFARERRELLGHWCSLVDPLMIVLGVAFLALIVLDLAQLPLPPSDLAFFDRATNAIYAIFVFDFAVRLLLANDRLAFLRHNWILAVSLILPFFRVVRGFQALAAVRTVQAVQMLGGVNRGFRALHAIVGGAQIAYLIAVSVVVDVLGAALVVSLEQDEPTSSLRTFGEAIWWSSTLITTINSSDDPVGFGGRVVAVVLRLYAISIFAYLAGSIAGGLVKRRVVDAVAAPPAAAIAVAATAPAAASPVSGQGGQPGAAPEGAAPATAGSVETGAGREASKGGAEDRDGLRVGEHRGAD